MSVLEIARSLNEKVKRAKEAKDTDHNKTTALFTVLPTYILGAVSTILSYLSINVGVTIPGLVKGN